MSQKTLSLLKNLVVGGLMLMPAVALVVAGGFYGKILLPGVGDLFFPFITGKNIFFRILVELLVIGWVFLATFDKQFRPKITPVLIAISATLGALIVSTIFSVDVSRSFWSNFERMEGFITHAHIFLYFLVLSSTIRTQIDWRRIFFSTVSVSFIITSYAYFQLFGFLRIFQSGTRLDATLGNSTYLAIYVIFHVFILLYLFYTSRAVWAKYLMVGLILYELPILFFTATRGAILGFLGGILLFGLLVGLVSNNRKAKISSLAAIGAVILLVATFFAIRSTTFAEENYVLQRFTNLSFSDQTVQSRLTIWNMSFDGLKERPLIGWGLENYNVVFNKYYNPVLWNQESWFDRAHNVLFDWLITTGLIGFAAYISIFFSAIYMMWKASGESRIVLAIFTSLFAVYAFHNLLVFDNITSYILFFTVLAFIHVFYLEFKSQQKKKEEKIIPAKVGSVQYVIPVFVSVLMIFSLYFFAIKPILGARALIGAFAGANGGDVQLVLDRFSKAISYGETGRQEAREHLSAYARSVETSAATNEQKVAALSLAINELEKQVEANPLDARAYLFLSSVYLSAQNLEAALFAIDKALFLSPTKQNMLFVKSDILLSLDRKDEAIAIARHAYELDPTFNIARSNFALIAIAAGESKQAEEFLESHNETTITPDQRFINAYARAGEYEKVLEILKVFVEANPDNVQYRISLSAGYLRLDRNNEAIKELEIAIELDPEFESQGRTIIEDIRSGNNPF